MNLYKFTDYSPSKKKLKKRKVAIAVIVIVVVLVSLFAFCGYIASYKVREGIDKYIFRKEITENNIKNIEISTEENQYIYAYDRYIVTLSKNNLNLYSQFGKKEEVLQVNIGTPIFKANNRFLAIGEKNGGKICLISGTSILWQKDIEGSLIKLNVNKNGYVSAIVSDTSYKTVIITYNPEGKELFKTYLSSTTAEDIDISNDNKYLAIAEISTSGSIIKSSVKIISIEKAQSDPSNSIVHTYNAENDVLITKIKYQDKNKLVCMYNDKIHMIVDEQDEVLEDLEKNKINFADIKASNSLVKCEEKNQSVFKTNSQISIVNLNTKKENIYMLDGIPKSMYTYDNTIALNLGTEVHFINSNGWLIKKYVSNQEITDIVLGSNIAGIIYRDKIEIIVL